MFKLNEMHYHTYLHVSLIGKTLGFCSFRMVDSCGRSIMRGQHIKHLPLSLAWDALMHPRVLPHLLRAHKALSGGRPADWSWLLSGGGGGSAAPLGVRGEAGSMFRGFELLPMSAQTSEDAVVRHSFSSTPALFSMSIEAE